MKSPTLGQRCAAILRGRKVKLVGITWAQFAAVVDRANRRKRT